MCKIYATRKSPSTVYVELEDESLGYWGVRKLSIPKYEYAKKFGNMHFLAIVAKETDADKDEDDVMLAVPFVDKDIQYSRRDYLYV